MFIFRLLITFANSLVQYRERQSWSGSKQFDILIVFPNFFFEEDNFEKSHQTATKTRKIPSMQSVMCPYIWLVIRRNNKKAICIHLLPNVMNKSSYRYWKLTACNISTFIVQSNLDYTKWQGPQESFRIIGSSNDRKREFSDIFGKARTFHRTSLFCQSSQLQLVFSVIGTSVKAFKKMNFLEVMVASSLMLCRCKIAEKKENRSLLTSTTCIYMKQLKIKVKCKLTNHIQG